MVERAAHLAGDLGLAHDHRLEAGGHAEQVPRGSLAAQHLQFPAQALHHRHRGAVDVEVDLEPVAGAQHDLTGDSVACEQGIGELVTPRRAEPFEFGEVVRAMARGQAHQHRASIDLG